MGLKVLKILGAFAASLFATAAYAAVPVSGGIGMQPPATDIAREVVDFHTLLVVVISSIVVFVTLLLIWVVLRYNRKANPVPKTFSHNTPIEIAWTVIPVFILAFPTKMPAQSMCMRLGKEKERDPVTHAMLLQECKLLGVAPRLIRRNRNIAASY